jgi:hypothetical protein
MAIPDHWRAVSPWTLSPDGAGARVAAEAGLAPLPKARYGHPSAWERELLEDLVSERSPMNPYGGRR